MKTIKELISTRMNSDNTFINLCEHLRSLTPEAVLYKLQHLFSKDIHCATHYNDSSNSGLVLSVPVGAINSTEKFERFREALDRMQWYITADEGPGYERKTRLFGIEPVYAKNVTTKVLSRPYIFHISSTVRSQKYVSGMVRDTIVDVGMRIKGRSIDNPADYRAFPARVHFISPSDDKDFKDKLFRIMNDLNIRPENIRMFRINTKKLQGINFYQDPMYEVPGFIYAYVNIPWSEMEEIDIFTTK